MDLGELEWTQSPGLSRSGSMSSVSSDEVDLDGMVEVMGDEVQVRILGHEGKGSISSLWEGRKGSVGSLWEGRQGKEKV